MITFWKKTLVWRLVRKFLLMILRLNRKLMKKIYRFDNWHCYILSDKPYAFEIVKFCNKIPNRETALEIGCGLGDIIRRIKFKHKTGWDISMEVLKAAKLFSCFQQDKTDFRTANFLYDIPENKFDVIICVNWIHSVPADTLRDRLNRLFIECLKDDGYLIIDTVQDKSYEYNHNVCFLTKGLNCNINKIGNYNALREVFAIKKQCMIS